MTNLKSEIYQMCQRLITVIIIQMYKNITCAVLSYNGLKLTKIWLRQQNSGDGMQTAALAHWERLRTNRRHAHFRQPNKRLQLIYCN